MDEVHGQADLLIMKQRHGPTGNIKLNFEANFTKFGNFISKDHLIVTNKYKFMKTEDRNTFLDINLRAIKKNYKIIKNKIGKHCTAAATVKANLWPGLEEKLYPV